VDGVLSSNGIDSEPPFVEALEGWIGIFQFEIFRDAIGDMLSEGCTLYNQQFTSAPSKVLEVSQFCALLAPTSAMLAILIAASEMSCLLRFYGSFVSTSILLMLAAATQGGTFSIFANPDFSCDSDTRCDVGTAVYFSASAALSFFPVCILLCCSPRPAPCCRVFRKDNEDKENI
jgi:hypothetical protein